NAEDPFGILDAIVVKIDVTAGSTVQYVRRLGGSDDDYATAIALDDAENVYITGSTTSSDAAGFPIVSPYQATYGGGYDAFISKLDASGDLVYSSYLGGSNTDLGRGIAVDPRGDLVYLTGYTSSPNFPTTSPPSTPQGTDAFITKLDLASNTLVYSRLFGSPASDAGRAVAIDASGSTYVVGTTGSTAFLSLHPLAEMTSRGGSQDAFLTRFDPAGNPVYSTRIGGAANEYAYDVATRETPEGVKVVVVGVTYSTDFPPAAARPAFQPAHGGGSE